MIELDIPDEYKCPITMDIMSDPIICQDGFTYERTSILNLPNNISPMTRQPIDKNMLIPNLALRQIIEKFAKSNNIILNKPARLNQTNNVNRSNNSQIEGPFPNLPYSQITRPPPSRPIVETNDFRESFNQLNQNNNFTSRLDNLQRERESTLLRFEREQREQMLARQNEYQRELENRRRTDELARQNRLREEQEKQQIERLVPMFNSKMPSLTGSIKVGCQNGTGNIYIYPVPNTRLQISSDIINRIKNENTDVLFGMYKKIIQDFIWIKKYVIGNGIANPYVDFVFDNYIDNLDTLITRKEQEIEQRNKTNSWNINQYFNEKQMKEQELNVLTGLKNIKANPRVYYYVNFDNSYLDYKKINWQNISTPGSPQKPHQNWLAQQENIIQNYLKEFLEKYNIKSIAKIQNPYPGNPTMDVEIIQSHRDSIIYNRQVHRRYGSNGGASEGSHYYQFFEKEDYNGLINLGNIIIELIEFVRPEIVLMDQNSV